MVMKSSFHGIVAPVFACYDTNLNIDVAKIPSYASYLASHKVEGVLVNGTVGEGVLHSRDEREKVAEAWVEACKRTNLYMMVHVGGTTLTNVLASARHAEKIGASSILCMPDLFFRPNSIEELIKYLCQVSEAAPKTPLFYYHYPGFTGIQFNMVEFLQEAKDRIPTIAGLKYTHNNLEEAIHCSQLYDRVFTIFLGNEQLICAVFASGMDSIIATVVNFDADDIYRIINCIKSGKINEAIQIQKKITELTVFLKKKAKWINSTKFIFEKITNMDLGPPRLPVGALTDSQKYDIMSFCKANGWITDTPSQDKNQFMGSCCIRQ